MSKFKRGEKDKTSRFKRRADRGEAKVVFQYGVEGAPGFMYAPTHCKSKKIDYGGKLHIDLCICRWYCKEQCTEWEEFSKTIGKKVVYE